MILAISVRARVGLGVGCFGVRLKRLGVRMVGYRSRRKREVYISRGFSVLELRVLYVFR